MTGSHAATFRALGDETRLGILAQLRDGGEQRAGDLAEHYPHLSRPAVSRHLGVLHDAGLVQAEPRGTERWYRLDPEPLKRLDEFWFAAYKRHWSSSLDKLKLLAEAAGDN